MSETLSVVVPVYNVEKYLTRALDSILQQTYPVYEIICVDDGSTDHSLDILQEYAKKDSRIKVIHKENGGSTSARKAGLEKARGTYTAFVDSDDFIESMMYEEMMALAIENQADLVTSGFIRDYGNSITVNGEKIKAGVYTTEQMESEILCSLIDTHSFYRTSISPSLCNKIFRTDQLKKVQLCIDDRIIVGDDDAVTYPFLFSCKTMVVSGKSYYHYCIRETGSNLEMKKVDDYDSVSVFLKHLEQAFYDADKPGRNLKKQFQLLKASFLMLRCAPRILNYDGERLYPFGEVRKQDKLLLYGAGKFGVEMKAYLEEQGFHLTGWVDKSANRPGVIRPNDISKVEYDCVIIAVLIADAVEHIKMDLNKMGVSEGKILFADPKMIGKVNGEEKCRK